MTITMAATTMLLLWICAMASIVTATSSGSSCKDISTFNTAQLAVFPYKEMRRPALIEALKRSTDDVMCLQELWFEEDVSAVLDEVQINFPFHYSKIHLGVGQVRDTPCAAEQRSPLRDTACTKAETKRLLAALTPCIIANGCHLLPVVQQAICTSTRCAAILTSGVAREECIQCVFLQNPKPMNEGFEICSTQTSAHNRLNAPGLVLLSKDPISDVSYTKLFPDNMAVLERGYIHATLNDGKSVVCTHLSSDFPFYPEFDMPFHSYEEQSHAEIKLIADKFNNTNTVLTGDFNVGPRMPDSNDPEKDLSGELPGNYDFLMSYGYENPYLEQDGRCTFCEPTNPFVVNKTSKAIDYVLYPKDAFTSPIAKRIYDVFQTIPLSDHYGVNVRVCDP